MSANGEQRLAAKHVTGHAQPAQQQRAIASPWCNSAVRRRSEKISERPNMMRAQAVAGAMRAGGCMSTPTGMGASENCSRCAFQPMTLRIRIRKPMAASRPAAADGML